MKLQNSLAFRQKPLNRCEIWQKEIDRFHLAFAENANADILLTTDAKFEKSGSKLILKLIVINPLDFIRQFYIEGDKE